MKMKKWEIALAVGLFIAVIVGVSLEMQQRALSDKLVRLHVVANSDSEADQQLKLQVRDRVLLEADALLTEAQDAAQAQELLRDGLQLLEIAAGDEIARRGYNYNVRAEIAPMDFPTKEYDTFSLPAGRYDALRLVIGEGGGQNWWCVVFPPLCAAAAQEVSEEAALAGLTGSEVSLITEEAPVYEIKFKALEVWNDIKGFFAGK